MPVEDPVVEETAEDRKARKKAERQALIAEVTQASVEAF